MSNTKGVRKGTSEVLGKSGWRMDRASFQTEQTKCSGSEEGTGGVERPPELERLVWSSRTWGLTGGDPINQTKELGFDGIRDGGES